MIWYQIRVFGDVQYMGDCPRLQTRSIVLGSVNGSFTWESFLSAFIDPSSTADIKSSFAKSKFYTSSIGPYQSEDSGSHIFDVSSTSFVQHAFGIFARHFEPKYG